MRPGTRDEFIQEFRQQLVLLEELFEDPDLAALKARRPGHPAAERHTRLSAMLEHGAKYRTAEEFEFVLDTTSSMIDRFTWGMPSDEGQFWDRFESDTASHFVRSRINDPAQFGDVMSELFVWGWLRSHDVGVRLNQEDGLADLRISSSHGPVWADVKRIRLGTKPSHVRSVIAKANKQIKRSGAQAGLAFIQVERSWQRASLDDGVPSDVQPYINEAARELGSDCSKSVAKVVVFWDEFYVATENGRSLYTIIRKSKVLQHSHARATLPLADEEIAVGMTAFMVMIGSTDANELPPLDLGDVVFTPLFREENERTDGVRTGHVMEALRNPDNTSVTDLGGVLITLVTRRVTVPTTHHVLLVIATNKPPSQALEVYAAFKLFGSAEELEDFVQSPTVAFHTFLARYGVPVRVGSREGLFVAQEALRIEPGETAIVSIAGEQPEKLFISAVTRAEPPNLFVYWAYCIDTGRYRDSLRRGM